MGIDWLNTVLVSVSMAADCMCVGASDGLKEPEMKTSKLALIAFLFGFFQFLMPTIGYFVLYFIINYGLNAEIQAQLEAWIPWIAFALLLFLGLKSIISWIIERRKEKEGEEEEHKPLTLPAILLQSLATSIDALCMGFVYSPLEYDIGQALLVFGTIGVVTVALSTLTLSCGKLIGDKLEKWAGLIAGIVFIGVGLKILLEGVL